MPARPYPADDPARRTSQYDVDTMTIPYHVEFGHGRPPARDPYDRRPQDGYDVPPYSGYQTAQQPLPPTPYGYQPQPYQPQPYQPQPYQEPRYQGYPEPQRYPERYPEPPAYREAPPYREPQRHQEPYGRPDGWYDRGGSGRDGGERYGSDRHNGDRYDRERYDRRPDDRDRDRDRDREGRRPEGRRPEGRRPETRGRDERPPARRLPWGAERAGSQRPAAQKAKKVPVLVRGTLGAAVLLAIAASVVRAGAGPGVQRGQATLNLGRQPATALQTGAPGAQAGGAASAGAAGAAGKAPTSCRARYTVTSRAEGRFTAVLTLTNTGTTALEGWSLAWAYPPGTRVSDGWNAQVATAADGAVTARDVPAAHVLAAGASTTIGFIGTFSTTAGTDPARPTSSGFSLNGVMCK